MNKTLLTTVGGILFFVFAAGAITNLKVVDYQPKAMKVQLENKEQKIERLETHREVLQEKIEKVEPKADEAEKLRQEKEQADQEIERLNKELQAKAERQRIELAEIEHRKLRETANKAVAAETTAPIVEAAPAQPTQAVAPSNQKEEWMSAAGIPADQWEYVDSIVTRESSWNPEAVNPNGGACGLAQQLPCGKWDAFGPWNDPVAALRAQHEYVNVRYGGYAQAVAFWNANKWY